jgi:hypothetical protein
MQMSYFFLIVFRGWIYAKWRHFFKFHSLKILFTAKSVNYFVLKYVTLISRIKETFFLFAIRSLFGLYTGIVVCWDLIFNFCPRFVYVFLGTSSRQERTTRRHPCWDEKYNFDEIKKTLDIFNSGKKHSDVFNPFSDHNWNTWKTSCYIINFCFQYFHNKQSFDLEIVLWLQHRFKKVRKIIC